MKSSIGLFYQLTVRDKNGKVVRKTRLRRSKSFVVAFLQLLEVQMKQGAVDIKDTDGATTAHSQHSLSFVCNGGIGEVTYGIMIGTGATAPDNADYVMETLIAHGSGATQINYAAVSFVAAQEVGANVDFQIIRSMQNLSGGTIQVTEAGLYIKSSTKSLMAIHDVFTAVPVGDGETITVTYTLRTTV